jgi:hypothetical protein
MPFPPAPFGMPPMPQAPPMPAAAGAPTAGSLPDYTQHLFGYLQAWRQYLEQATGTVSGPPQPPATQPSATQEPGTQATVPPEVHVRPASDYGNQIDDGASFYIRPPSAHVGPHTARPPKVVVPPADDFGSRDLPSRVMPPTNPLGNQDPGQSQYRRRTDAAHPTDKAPRRGAFTESSKSEPKANPSKASPKGAPKSLYSSVRRDERP